MLTLEELNVLNKGRTEVKLDIGAGGFSSDTTFLSVDAYTESDIPALMWDIPLPDSSVDYIFASQSMEHISKFNVVPTLREWVRLLKPNGKAQIIVPDLEWICWWWLTHQSVDWDMDILFGHQKHEGEYHRTGYTPTILKNYVDVAGGFKVMNCYYVGGDFAHLQFDEQNRVRGTINGRSIVMELLRNADS